MAEESQDAKAPKPDEPKKQPETVLLTSEELRAIAGGQQQQPPPGQTQPKIVSNIPGTKTIG
jgi:hypothetical protein